jgi:hypothetical protein
MKGIVENVKTTKDAQGKMEEFRSESDILVERLLEEKYATPAYESIALGIDEVYSNPLTRRRAANTILKMDNQEKFFEQCLKHMNEATFTANFGATPQAILRSIRVSNPNSVIEDICEVQTVSSMVGLVGYIKPIFSASMRGATQGSLIVESKADYYASENLDEVIATSVSGNLLYSGTLTYTPIRPTLVKVIFDGVEVAQDDGNGKLVNMAGSTFLSTASGASNIVSYTNGSVSLSLASNPGSGKTIAINYNYDTEQNTNAHGEVELVWTSTPVTMEMNPLFFKFSLTSMLLAQAANFSVEEVMNDAATQYLKQERDRKGVDYNARLALSNSTITFDASPSAGGDNNNKMRAQMLELKIEAAANAMYEATGRGGVSYLIAGSSAAAYMDLLDNFVKDNSASPIGCYKVGMLGRAPVIKARVNNLATDEILVGYRSEWGEAPFIHADYLDYATESLTLRDFITQKGLASYYKNIKVEPRFVRKIKINNLPA